MSDEPVLLLPFRAIGMLIPDCALEEHHTDRMVITEHPVEQGASISDHAYKMPQEVSLHFGWSNSSQQSSGESYVKDTYDQLLQMQASRQTFSITTGKRQYIDMLCVSLDVITDSTSEYSLMVHALCKQVIIVQTQSASLAPASAQASPNLTAGSVDRGTQVLRSLPASASQSSGGAGLG